MGMTQRAKNRRYPRGFSTEHRGHSRGTPIARSYSGPCSQTFQNIPGMSVGGTCENCRWLKSLHGRFS